jgi:4-carboxymuconolactone decarboxylase
MDDGRVGGMSADRRDDATMGALDEATRALVVLAAVIATGSERALRDEMARAVVAAVPPAWVEELILQSYLFAGFPRTLNAMREWRRVSGRTAPDRDAGEEYANVGEWAASGEETCAVVYGPMYERLRVNIRHLHPALDSWMIVDGYGKVLSRPGLDLRRRELCVVAVCAAAGQERQLHSHLHGALHAGAAPAEVEETLAAVAPLMDDEMAARARHLWARVKGK